VDGDPATGRILSVLLTAKVDNTIRRMRLPVASACTSPGALDNCVILLLAKLMLVLSVWRGLSSREGAN
jgi:hypothetical protein